MPERDLISRTLYQGRDRAAARSFLHAIGLTNADIDKPFVGVSNVWTETMPCNFGLRDLAKPLKSSIKAAGANPMEFNTIAISDGITMGTEGMKTSLVSREVIADSIELVARGHMFDAMCTLCACDKTIPASAGSHAHPVMDHGWVRAIQLPKASAAACPKTKPSITPANTSVTPSQARSAKSVAGRAPSVRMSARS